MQMQIPVLVLASLTLAAIFGYLGFRARDGLGDWRARAYLPVVLAVALPLFLLTLWSPQSDARERLAELGILPHPALDEPMDPTAGAPLSEIAPVWHFSSRASATEIRDFYLDPGNRPGWRLQTDARDRLVFLRGGQRMTIGIRDSGTERTVVYRLDESRPSAGAPTSESETDHS